MNPYSLVVLVYNVNSRDIGHSKAILSHMISSPLSNVLLCVTYAVTNFDLFTLITGAL